jgi:hypothetical protein
MNEQKKNVPVMIPVDDMFAWDCNMHDIHSKHDLCDINNCVVRLGSKEDGYKYHMVRDGKINRTIGFDRAPRKQFDYSVPVLKCDRVTQWVASIESVSDQPFVDDSITNMNKYIALTEEGSFEDSDLASVVSSVRTSLIEDVDEDEVVIFDKATVELDQKSKSSKLKSFIKRDKKKDKSTSTSSSSATSQIYAKDDQAKALLHVTYPKTKDRTVVRTFKDVISRQGLLDYEISDISERVAMEIFGGEFDARRIHDVAVYTRKHLKDYAIFRPNGNERVVDSCCDKPPSGKDVVYLCSCGKRYYRLRGKCYLMGDCTITADKVCRLHDMRKIVAMAIAGYALEMYLLRCEFHENPSITRHLKEVEEMLKLGKTHYNIFTRFKHRIVSKCTDVPLLGDLISGAVDMTVNAPK